jgi:cytochrome c551/c552
VLIAATSATLFAESSAVSPQRAMLDRYCVTCHNQKLKTGGLTLDRIDLDKPAEGAETWEKVIRKLRGGMMPPQGMPRPDKATLDTFVSWLEESIDARRRRIRGATRSTV